MVNESTTFTPARILYGFELTTPAQWHPAADRVVDENPSDTLADRIRKMDVSREELRQQAAEHSARSQARMQQQYNRTVQTRSFKEGDLVLLRIDAPNQVQTAKFSQLYEGPYTVVRVYRNGVYEIASQDGNRDSVHVDRLRPYTAHSHMVPELLAAARSLRSTLRRYRTNGPF